MGLLDDAIREHLELKRLRGADPGDVARAENEALGPVQREAEPPTDGEPPAQEDGGAAATAVGESASEVSDHGEVEHERTTAASVGQETVEIDMEQALAGESTSSEPAGGTQTGGRAAPVGHPAHTQPSTGDSLEWEMPGDRAEDEASAAEEPSEDEAVEDVLEETPDFLRETPEHERLWFEQRPPRDFDFNE